MNDLGLLSDSRIQTIGATQGTHGQSAEIEKKQILYEIGVTAAPHPVPCLMVGLRPQPCGSAPPELPFSLETSAPQQDLR